MTDFFIVCEAASTTQVKAIADSVEEEVRKNCDELPYKHEGRQTYQWVLIDYVNVVVHVMLPENRRFYKLEDMWSDAPQEKHQGRNSWNRQFNRLFCRFMVFFELFHCILFIINTAKQHGYIQKCHKTI